MRKYINRRSFEVYVSEMILHLIHLLGQGLVEADETINSIKVLELNAASVPEIFGGVIQHVSSFQDLSPDLKEPMIDSMPTMVAVEEERGKSVVGYQAAATKPKKTFRKMLVNRVKCFMK